MTLPTWAPSVEKIAAHMPTRFHGSVPTASTIPTLNQVQHIIEHRVAEVRLRCGDIDASEDDTLIDYATETAALGAAAYIASSFWPEQQMSSDEATFLRMRYEEHISDLRRKVLYRHRATRQQ